jgi:hypothetical protein
VNDINDFVDLLRDGLGLPVTDHELYLGWDEVPGWDSAHLLWLLVRMEETTGRRVALPDVLEARSLQGVYALYTSA